MRWGGSRNAGHDVKMLSLRPEGDDYPEILENEVKRFRPQVIGISMRNIDDQTMKDTAFLLGPVKEVVKRCRDLSDAAIVLGGAGYSIFPSGSLTYTGADMGIRGRVRRRLSCFWIVWQRGRNRWMFPVYIFLERGCRRNPISPKAWMITPCPFPISIWKFPGIPRMTPSGCPFRRGGAVPWIAVIVHLGH